MIADRPILLVRARPSAEIGAEFGTWFRKVHLRDAARIPGIIRVERGCTPGGTWLGIYSFESADGVQEALASPEAAYARGTWEQWGDRLEELRVEIFAPAGPLPLYHAIN